MKQNSFFDREIPLEYYFGTERTCQVRIMQHAHELYSQDDATTKTILVVEDDRDIGEFLDLALTQETPYHTLLVADGFQALTVVRAITPALFLLDYQLPRMTGIQVYDRLHAITGLERVPTILMSANLPRHELHKRQIVGLIKPFELDELLRLIHELVD
jgi:DNA-binding response OmpR family regulator